MREDYVQEGSLTLDSCVITTYVRMRTAMQVHSCIYLLSAEHTVLQSQKRHAPGAAFSELWMSLTEPVLVNN